MFTYDGLGRRVQIVELINGVAASTNKYLWCGLDLSEQRSVVNGVTKRFFGQGEQIAGTSYYFTRDHLGSIREMVDSVGTIQARYSYDPYGRKTKVCGNLDADFGYAGNFYHATSGLGLTFLRAYDPDLARWLSRDPIAENGGLNLYCYVLNNSVNWIDPYGAQCGAATVYQVGKAGYDAIKTSDNSLLNARSNLNAAATSTNLDDNLNVYDPATRANAAFNLLYSYRTNGENLALSFAKTRNTPVNKAYNGLQAFTGGLNVLYALHGSNAPPVSSWHYNGQNSLNDFQLTSIDLIIDPKTHNAIYINIKTSNCQ